MSWRLGALAGGAGGVRAGPVVPELATGAH